MKILLTGVETNNKGAELMLYAILQEIERRFPDATVFISANRIKQGVEYVKTDLDFRAWPYESLVSKLRLIKIFRSLHFPYCLLPHTYALRNVNYHFDGSGFAYSDQFHITGSKVYYKKRLLEFLSRRGCKNIFLPQAFGPVEKTMTRKMLAAISEYASIIMPREKVSFNYLRDSGSVDMTKVRLYTDFTSLVGGTFPSQYEHLRNAICIIPNSQMINKGAISMEKYLTMLRDIVSDASSSNKKVYMLNHAGKQDKQLCNTIKGMIPNGIEMVTDLNALEVKGLIGSAYLVISSRFHGVASALNSCVPCLATSWSHKYEELFNDYKMHDCILPLDNNEKAINQINSYLQTDTNQGIRIILKERVPQIKEKTRDMWNTIWSI